jgi:hypothetical protein
MPLFAHDQPTLPAGETVTFATTCRACAKEQALTVRAVDLLAWRNGTAIQNAMPYLNADDRELLISGICGVCFDRMFGA